MAQLAKRSLIAGEITPHLYPSTGFEKYLEGLSLCRNYFVNRFNGITNRPGTIHVTDIPNTVSSDRGVRLFSYEDYSGEAISHGVYVVLLTWDSSVITASFYKDDVRVDTAVISNLQQDTTSDGSPMPQGFNQLASLAELDFKQVGGRIIITHRDYHPVVITKTTEDVDSVPTNIVFTAALYVPLPNSEAPSTLRVGTAGDGFLTDATAIQGRIGNGVNRTWRYWVTSVSATTGEESLPKGLTERPVDDAGMPTETVAQTLANNTRVLINTGTIARPTTANTIALRWSPVEDALFYNVYRSLDDTRNGQFLAVVESDVRDPYFMTPTAEDDDDVAQVIYFDYGQNEPSAGVSFSTNTNPFGRSAIDGTFEFNENFRPHRVSEYQQRLILANTITNPTAIAFSVTGLIDNFTTGNPLISSDSIKMALVSGFEVRSIVDANNLIVFMRDSIYVMYGDEAGAVTPLSRDIRRVQNWGIEDIQPLVIGDHVFYVQEHGLFIQVLDSKDRYKSTTVNRYGIHLFEGKSIIDWTYAHSPFSNVWIVNDEGELICITYALDEGIIGHSRHDFQEGEVEAVTSVRGDKEDVVYLVVDRDGTRTLEKFAPRNFGDIEDAIFMDSTVSFDGSGRTEPFIIGGTGSVGDAHRVTFSSALTTDDPNLLPAVDDEIRVLHNNFTHRFRVVSIHMEDLQYDVSIVSALAPGTMELPGILRSNVPITNWSLAKKIITHTDDLNLTRLQNTDLSILADGGVVSSPLKDTNPLRLDVNDSTITLPFPAVKVHVGLPYAYDVKTLDVDLSGITTLNDQKKLIKEVGVYTRETRGLFASLELPEDDSVTDMFEFKVDGYTVEQGRFRSELATDYKQVRVQSRWDTNGRVSIRGVDPLPATILAIYPIGALPRSVGSTSVGPQRNARR